MFGSHFLTKDHNILVTTDTNNQGSCRKHRIVLCSAFYFYHFFLCLNLSVSVYLSICLSISISISLFLSVCVTNACAQGGSSDDKGHSFIDVQHHYFSMIQTNGAQDTKLPTQHICTYIPNTYLYNTLHIHEILQRRGSTQFSILLSCAEAFAAIKSRHFVNVLSHP